MRNNTIHITQLTKLEITKIHKNKPKPGESFQKISCTEKQGS